MHELILFASFSHPQFFTKGNMVVLKDHAPYTPELEHDVLLNPMARTAADKDGSFSFPKVLPSAKPKNDNAAVSISYLAHSFSAFKRGCSRPSSKLGADQNPLHSSQIAQKLIGAATSAVHGVGTDVELISSINSDNANFVARNFTEQEISYCQAQPDPRASFAARWAGKEAAFKSLKTESKGAAAAMKEIEIVASASGPTIVLHGAAKELATSKGITSFNVSLSHSEDVAVAVVVASA